MSHNDYSTANSNPVSSVQGLTTAHAAGVVVLACVAALVLIRRGFRGVNVGGVNVGIK